MIAEGNAEAGCRQQRCGDCEVEPINTEVPQVQRHCGQRENKCADQERARRPIDPVGRNSENQGKGEIVSPVLARPAPRTLLKWATENHVFFCPGMNAAAMRTGELLHLHFGGRPELFFYGASGIGQL